MGPHSTSNMEPLVVNHNYHETKNKQHRLKSTNYNLQAQPFEPGEESACFPIGPLEWVTGAKNFNDSCTFDLHSHVIAKHRYSSEEFPGRLQNKSLCQRNISWVLNRKTLSGETFCLPGKRLLSILNIDSKIVVWVTSGFFTSWWMAYNQLSWNVLLFSCNLIGQLCISVPGYSSCTVNQR